MPPKTKTIEQLEAKGVAQRARIEALQRAQKQLKTQREAEERRLRTQQWTAVGKFGAAQVAPETS